MTDIKRRATIADIAIDTGLSVATVSRTLNNSEKVTEKTKKIILKSIKKLNYIPNIGAKELAEGKSASIGLVLSDNSHINDLFSASIDKEILNHELNLIVYNSDSTPLLQEKYIKLLTHRRVMGIIVLPVVGEYYILEYPINAKIPVLVINRFVKDYKINHVLFDFRLGIKQAIDYLAQVRGKKHIFQLAREDIYYGIERRKDFIVNLSANNILHAYNPVYPVQDNFDSGYYMMNSILYEHKKVDAVICSSDYSAVGAIRAIKDKRLRIPEDIAVVGLYNTKLSDYYFPRISTIDADVSEFAKVSADRIIELINNPEDSQIKNLNLPTKFINKETT